MTNTDMRLEQAIAAIDAANSADPNHETVDGDSVPKELLYSRRMTEWLERLTPDASDALRIAARAQHIERWTSRRGDYPEGREGYYRWRQELAKFHARRASEIMADCGYDAEVISRAGDLLQKKRLKQDPEVQTLEDVICLVFLENYLADFSGTQTDEKIIDILRKTWRKMSSQGHQSALELDLSGRARDLVERALASDDD